MATGYLYSATTPSPSHFTGHPTEGATVTVNSVSPMVPNSQVQVDNKNTHHKLLLTLTVTVGTGSMVVVQTMEGDSSNTTDSIGGSEMIISGTLSDSKVIRVGNTDVTVTLTTDGNSSRISASSGEVQSDTIIKVPGVNGTLAVTASGIIHRRQFLTNYDVPFNLKVDGNTPAQIAAVDRRFILQGTKTSQMTVNVPQPETPPRTIPVPGVYAECTNANQTFVSEV